MKTCILYIIASCLLCFPSSSPHHDVDKEVETIYAYYRSYLDNGDTIKLKALTYGYCPYESLTQIVKKNDSTLIVKSITTPCLNDKEHNTSPTIKKRANSQEMPPIEEFDYIPYSIELPISAINYWNFNLKDACGKINIINNRTNLTTKQVVKHKPYTEYGMNFIEFIAFAQSTNEQYGLFDYVINKYGGVHSREVDLFSDDFKQSFGKDATFSLYHMWGVRITNDIIVIIENVQNGLNFEEDTLEADFSSVFIKMAESVKPINPNVFNLKDLSSYKEY